MYDYKAKVLRWVDGDTILVLIDLGFYVHREERLRLARVNTPELRSKDPEERKKANEVVVAVNELCPVGSTIMIDSKSRDRYGRYIAELLYEDQNINDFLLDNGYAEFVEY